MNRSARKESFGQGAARHSAGRGKRGRAAASQLEALSEMLRELVLPDDVAELRHFVELCRKSLAIRSWLFARFANEPATRTAFRALLSDPAKVDVKARLWSPQITQMVVAPSTQSAPTAGPHGGLSKGRILALIVRYQYELMDLKTFLLVRLWLRFIATGKTEIPVGLWRITLKHWSAMVADPKGGLIRDTLHAVRFFHERSKRPIGETDFGHNNSWKIHLLLHILDCPKPRYQVAELQAGLPPKYRHVELRLIRSFCQRHGIRRDTNPGRPASPKWALQRPPAWPAGRRLKPAITVKAPRNSS
ncbi:MAG TPA: hypothetical protein VG838_08415 [Opitutaceae bacterium]|nr:hypothetical protein [Opitutaceae bacterium]